MYREIFLVVNDILPRKDILSGKVLFFFWLSQADAV
jgi:hypothetical protein